MKTGGSNEGGGARAGHPNAESGHHKQPVGPKSKRMAAQWMAERVGLSQQRVCRFVVVWIGTPCAPAVNVRRVTPCGHGFASSACANAETAVLGVMSGCDGKADR